MIPNNYFGVVGLGNIGYSTMINYAAKQIRLIGYDVSAARVNEVNNGIVSIPGMQNWVEHSIPCLTQEGFIKATSDHDEFVSFSPQVIFVAVPTEIKGHPSPRIVAETFSWLFSEISSKRLVAPTLIVESTMAPGTTEKVILPLAKEFGLTPGKDLFMGVSPRRDWFKEAGKTVKDMERVYGGVTPACTEKVRQALTIICDKLFPASTYRIAELTKCLENTFRFVEISLANQFALAYPDVDVVETLTLASTKWNMEHYHPSIRIGGHCIPVAPRYVLEGAPRPEYLSLVKASVTSENEVIRRLVEIMKLLAVKRIALLGLGYRDNLKISIFSPAAELSRQLTEQGFEIRINDPLFTAAEIAQECGQPGCTLEEALAGADAIFFTSVHDEYMEQQACITAVPSVRFVIDNAGRTKSWNWDPRVSYFQVGDGKLLELEG